VAPPLPSPGGAAALLPPLPAVAAEAARTAAPSSSPPAPASAGEAPVAPPSAGRAAAPLTREQEAYQAALTALQNDLQRFELTQRSLERALWLLYIEGPGVPAFCERLLRRRFLIGSDGGCTLPLTGEGMAPQHAVLEYHDESDHWSVDPVTSDRPTFVNGKRVSTRTPLGPQDLVQVGPWRLRFGIEGDDEWHQKFRFATLHSQPRVLGLVGVGGGAKPDRLVVLSGPVPAKEIRLDEGPVRLGPVKGSSLVPEGGALAELDVEVAPLPDGRYELLCHGDGVEVTVNGRRERRAVLTPGDRMRLGGGSGAAYLVFAGREAGAAPAGDRGRDEGPRPMAAQRTALPGAGAPEGEGAWSLQAMGLAGAAPSFEEPTSEPEPELDGGRSSSSPMLTSASVRRISRPKASLVLAGALLAGACVTGALSVGRERAGRDRPAATAGASPTAAQALRPAPEPQAPAPAKAPPAARAPEAAPVASPAPAPAAATPRSRRGSTAEGPEATAGRAPLGPGAALRAAPEPPRTASARAKKEAPVPGEGADKGTLCDRLRALQHSGRATPDDERMLRRSCP
jgi:hypothetical protein